MVVDLYSMYLLEVVVRKRYRDGRFFLLSLCRCSAFRLADAGICREPMIG